MITISDGILTIPEDERFVGFTGDNLHSQKKFFIRSVPQSGWLYRLYLTFDDGRHNFFTLPATVSEEGTWLTWDIEESHILKSGLVKAQIKAFSQEKEVYHTTSDVFVAGLSTEEDEEFKNSNSEFLYFEKNLNDLYSKMLSASAKMPYVGTNGNWFTYDISSEQYVDSGISSLVDIGDGTLTPSKLDRAYWERLTEYTQITDASVLFDTVGYTNKGGGIAFVNVNLPVSENTAVSGFCVAMGVTSNKETVYLINLTDGTQWKINRTNEGDGATPVYAYDFIRQTSDTEDIKDGAVVEAKLADGAVTANKLADNSVASNAIIDSAVTSSKIAQGAIDDENLFSMLMRNKFFSLPVKSVSTSGNFTDDFYNLLIEQGIYNASSQTGERQTVIVFKPDSEYHLIQLKLSYDKIEYRGIYSSDAGVYNADEWTDWVDLTLANKKFGNLTSEDVGAKIVRGEITSIVLMGDSITDGFGGTAYNGSASSALSTNTEGYCWANIFKKFVEERYGIPVVNKGMYGTAVEYQKTQAVDFVTENDFVIWLSGTNNRNSDTAFEDYKSNIKSYIEAVKEKCGGMLFISGIPSTEANENNHSATMQQIDEVAFNAAHNNVPFISLYREFIKYCELHGIDLADTFYDHVHPNDLGYLIMFKLVCDKLGLPLSPYTDYSYSGDWWKGVFVLNTGLYEECRVFDSWTSSNVPVMQMAQYDADSNTTLFSGKTLSKIRVGSDKFVAGSLTIGTAALSTLGSSLTAENTITVEVGEDGVIDFGEEGFAIPENHTLLLGALTDTARLCYIPGSMAEVTTENYMYTQSHWLKSTPPAPYIRLVGAFYF